MRPIRPSLRARSPLRLDGLAFAMLGIGLGACTNAPEIPDEHPQAVATLTTVDPAERPESGRVTELQRSRIDRLWVTSDARRLDALEPIERPVPKDTWDRMRNGFRLSEHAEHDQVQNALQALSSQSNYLSVMARRGRPYLYFIVDQVAERNMPLEVALIPMVESAFEPYAFSHGQAAGIWQLIPTTGRRLGLKQNAWYDGRRDIHASTNAALDYLTRLNEIFDGDWLLTFAAYNAGQGTVLRAQRSAADAGKETDFWSILDRLPRETRHYVPRILALAEMVRDPEAYDQSLPTVPAEPYFVRVDVGSPIDLSLAADLAGLSPRELVALNPGYQRGMTDPDGPHHLLLPTDSAETFEQALGEVPEQERVHWYPHEVQPEETLGQIATAHNVSVEDIQAANDLDNHVIRAGATLRIPTANPHLDEGMASARTLHQVEEGENLWLIARRHDVGVDDIVRWNGLDKDSMLHPGQELVLRTRQPNSQAQVFHPPRQQISYRVRSGDSLHTIARKFGVTVEEIRQWNELAEQAPIHPGETLRIRADLAATAGN